MGNDLIKNNHIDGQLITGSGIVKGSINKNEALWINSIEGDMISGKNKPSKKIKVVGGVAEEDDNLGEMLID